MAEEHNLPRFFDLESNTLDEASMTRVNWRAFWLADACGAWKGGKAGARFGSMFSPSGTVAGAIVGGLLCAAVYSGVAAWTDNGIAYDDIIQHLDISDAEDVYGLFCQIPISELEIAKDETEIVSLAIDSIYQSVGIAHNVLLDEMLDELPITLSEEEPSISIENIRDGEPYGFDNLTRNGGPTESTDDMPMVMYSSFDLFYCQEATQVVASEEYKMYFTQLVEGDDEEDNSVAACIMNLFIEAVTLEGGMPEDVVSIANQYYTYINNSTELSQEDRYAICIGMAVASYSSNYWAMR